MKRVFFALFLLVAIKSLSSPRWGDDSDWLGDTLTIDRLSCIVNVGGDTLLCMSYKGGVYAVVQHDSTSFEMLAHQQLPPTAQRNYPPNGVSIPGNAATGYLTYPLVNQNHLLYGFPSGKLNWNWTSPPVYAGAIHHGFNFIPDTLLISPFGSTGGDSMMHFDYYNGIWFRGFGISHYLPVESHQLILYGNRIYNLNAADSAIGFTEVAGVTDWSVRWPYGYGVGTDSNQLVTVNLSLNPPQILSRLPINTAGFAQVINDTLITVQGNRWQCWSLSNPSQPVSLGITTLPFHLFWLENTTPDSLYFGWGGYHGLADVGGTTSYTTFSLFSFSQSIRNPRIVDTLHIGGNPGVVPPNPGSMTQTSFGWTGLVGIHKVLRDTTVHLDTLWVNNLPPVLFGPTRQPLNRFVRTDSVFYMFSDDGQHRVSSLTYRVGISAATRAVELDTCPFGSSQAWHNMMYYYPRLATFNQEIWQVDSLKLRASSPPFGTAMQFINSRLIFRYWESNHVVIRIFRILQDSAFFESSFTNPTDGSTYFLRDSSLITETSTQTLGLYRRSDTTWVHITGWEARLDSTTNFTTATKWDSLFLFGQKQYAVPSTGAPYVVKDLSPLVRALPMPQSSNYEIDISGNTVLVKFPNNFCGVYYVTSDTAILRGTILKNAPTQPNIVGTTAVIVGSDGISTYSIPPFNSVNDPFTGSLPSTYEIGKPYPNPFNSIVIFHFSLPRAGKTAFIIYDALGRQVYKQEMGELQAGKYLASWNGKNGINHIVGSGVYFLRFISGDFHTVKKVVLVK